MSSFNNFSLLDYDENINYFDMLLLVVLVIFIVLFDTFWDFPIFYVINITYFDTYKLIYQILTSSTQYLSLLSVTPNYNSVTMDDNALNKDIKITLICTIPTQPIQRILNQQLHQKISSLGIPSFR